MATHARQQYFADESSLSKEKREFSIAEEVQQKIDSIEEGAQVNTIETIKVNGVEVQPDENKAIDLAVPGVVDSLDSTSSTDALSARQGKVLYDYIQDVSHIGHFLALWNASTGLPVTNPDTSPYVYNTGDFYTISVVAPIGGTNYRPDGTQFVIGQASTTVETENISVNDFYFYDGQVWRHMINSGAGSIAIDDSLSTTSTNPVTNRRVTQAINSKQDVLTAGVGINIDSNNEITNTQPGPIISATQPSTANEGDQWYDTTNSVLKVYDGTQWNEVGSEGNTKTFYLSSTSDLVNAQAAYDWYLAGKNPILSVTFNNNKKNKVYVIDYGYRDSQLYFRSPQPRIINQNIHGVSDIDTEGLTFDISNGTVSAIYSFAPDAVRGFLNTNYNYPTPYTPQYPGSPATKKYVDDNVIQVGATAPSNPIEGMVWYDTTNDVLKSYDGTNWNEIGKEYNAGNGIRVGNYSPTQGPCAEGFHIPTETEWQSLLDTGASLAAWQEDSGDYSQSGVSEYLKLPYPPQLYDGVPYEDDTGGYWTSTAGTDGYSSCLSVTSGSAYITLYERYIGLNIRGFKDVPVAPDNTWTTLYDGSSTATGAGIFYKASLGLISISEDGTTWITIADKNVGATTVYEYGDTFSASNCGQYFQRGNNYGFPFAGATNTTKERVDTSNCTPGSYNSSTYIIASPDWSQPSNDNLWVETGTIISNTIMNIGVTSINGKTGDVNLESANTKTFYLSSTSDLTNAQAAYDWYLAGKNPIIVYSNKAYSIINHFSASTTFAGLLNTNQEISNSYTLINYPEITLNHSNNTVTSISIGGGGNTNVLRVDYNYSTPYTPQYNGSPATKKYVDDNVIQKSATAPSSPTEGMVWYDTTNDELKAYNGTSWQTEGTKMVVLEYGVSTWQDFLDAYNENAIVYCKVTSGSSGYRMAFMAYTAGQPTPTEVEFQYYRSRSSHNTDATQLDEVYVYKLTSSGVWSTTTRDTGARMAAGNGISISSVTSSGVTTRTISADAKVFAYPSVGNNVSDLRDWAWFNHKTAFLNTTGTLQYVDNYVVTQCAEYGLGGGYNEIYATNGTSIVKIEVDGDTNTVVSITTTQLGGLQVSPNSTITGIKYVWYGTESDYANLSQYYTDQPGDTEFHTF